MSSYINDAKNAQQVEIDKNWINYARNRSQRFVLKTNVNVRVGLVTMNMEEVCVIRAELFSSPRGWQVRNIVTQAVLQCFFISHSLIRSNEKLSIINTSAQVNYYDVLCGDTKVSHGMSPRPIQASAYEFLSNEALNSAGYSDHDSITISASFLQIKCIKKAFAKWIEHEIFSAEMVSQWTYIEIVQVQGTNWICELMQISLIYVCWGHK